MGMTDVDDKILAAAAVEGVDPLAHARRYEKEFLEDLQQLDVLPPQHVCRVSEYIPDILDFVKRLVSDGHAYCTNDGSVYFDTGRFRSRYGILAPESVQAAIKGNVGPGVGHKKKNQTDFALWKHTSNPSELSWESPWGLGRPGWHIECSAMSVAVFGETTLDVHTGGCDLLFPHHENELAQCHALLGHDQWVNYFLHSGHCESLGHYYSTHVAMRAH